MAVLVQPADQQSCFLFVAEIATVVVKHVLEPLEPDVERSGIFSIEDELLNPVVQQIEDTMFVLHDNG
ncbi:unnamed protein product [Nippostrongylus brasiliensis]|uniref:Histidine kinase n=1 Tax=Nippostrongylus brasiliensis TaxID=27835 RepID=A0A0N4Y5L6_NIPBR|nr:unnamed protein product [Nippostrongylus brasiliensis]